MYLWKTSLHSRFISEVWVEEYVFYVKIIYKRLLTKHLTELNTRAPHQFGFRPKHSPIHQLGRVSQGIVHNFEDRMFTADVFLDVLSAFDTGLLYILRITNAPDYITSQNHFFKAKHSRQELTVSTVLKDRFSQGFPSTSSSLTNPSSSFSHIPALLASPGLFILIHFSTCTSHP